MHLRAFEAELLGQPHGLAAAVGEQFGNAHGSALLVLQYVLEDGQRKAGAVALRRCVVVLQDDAVLCSKLCRLGVCKTIGLRFECSFEVSVSHATRKNGVGSIGKLRVGRELLNRHVIFPRV
jgi:hypothetical protein